MLWSAATRHVVFTRFYITFEMRSISRFVVIRAAAERIEQTASFTSRPVRRRLAIGAAAVGWSVARLHAAFQLGVTSWVSKSNIKSIYLVFNNYLIRLGSSWSAIGRSLFDIGLCESSAFIRSSVHLVGGCPKLCWPISDLHLSFRHGQLFSVQYHQVDRDSSRRVIENRPKFLDC